MPLGQAGDGHLAMAFDLTPVGQAATFNGAGVGRVVGTSLAQVRGCLTALIALIAGLVGQRIGGACYAFRRIDPPVITSG